MSSSSITESEDQHQRLMSLYSGFLNDHLGLIPERVTDFLQTITLTIKSSPEKVQDVFKVLEESENELVESFLDKGGYKLINTFLRRMQPKKYRCGAEEAIQTQLIILEFINNHPINEDRIPHLDTRMIDAISASEYEDEHEARLIAKEIQRKVANYRRNINANPSSSSQSRSNQSGNGCRAHQVVDKINSIIDSVFKTPRLVDDESTAFDRIVRVLRSEMPNLRPCFDNQ